MALVSYNKERVITLPDVKVGSWSWPDSMDQIITSRKTDVVRFETFDLRFVEVTIPAGQKQEMGEQSYPSVLIFYEPQPKDAMASHDGKTGQVDRKFDGAKFPQAIREGKQPPHSFENKERFPAHYYRVEFKKIQWKG